MKKKPSEHNGVVVIDKPAGMTSHDVVNRARRIFGTRRVGHTGTLDPDATGVLVICLGYATRIAEYLSAGKKSYMAEFTFGIETDTLDASGIVLRKCDASHLSEENLRQAMIAFQGEIRQVPPMVSAIRQDGKRLYEYAFAGETVEREARSVMIHGFELISFTPGAEPKAEVLVVCSSGTYIRTLADDLGRSLEVGAHMSRLRRNTIWLNESHAFTADKAVSLDRLEDLAANSELDSTVIPLNEALSGWQFTQETESSEAELRMGRAREDSELVASPEPMAALDPQGRVFAILKREDGKLQPDKVLFQR